MDYEHLRVAIQVQMEPKGQVCRCTMKQAILANRIATTSKKPGPPFTMIVVDSGEDRTTLPAGTRKDRLQTEDLKTVREVWLVPLNSETGMKTRMGRTITEQTTVKKGVQMSTVRVTVHKRFMTEDIWDEIKENPKNGGNPR